MCNALHIATKLACERLDGATMRCLFGPIAYRLSAGNRSA